MKILTPHIRSAVVALSCLLFAAGCSKTDTHPDAAIERFSISASNVNVAIVTMAPVKSAANPAQMEAIVAINFSPNGTAAFTDFVLAHANQPVKIMVDQYEDNVMFRGSFSNLMRGFDFHCASSNEAQRVADILNKK